MGKTDGIANLLLRHTFRYSNEQDLHDGIEQVLVEAGHDVQREVRLSPRNRIDLVVDGIGVEIKVDGATKAVRNQLARYAECDQVEGLILVSTRNRHYQACAPLNAKPVRFVGIGSL